MRDGDTNRKLKDVKDPKGHRFLDAIDQGTRRRTVRVKVPEKRSNMALENMAPSRSSIPHGEVSRP